MARKVLVVAGRHRRPGTLWRHPPGAVCCAALGRVARPRGGKRCPRAII